MSLARRFVNVSGLSRDSKRLGTSRLGTFVALRKTVAYAKRTSQSARE
jgi:hypothetical protein